MTPTEKGRRSDALYYETVSVTRRVLCDAIANREADLDDLRKENARLRESVNRLMTQRDERLARAEADNAKLREQVDAAHMSRLLTENENESLRELVRDMYVVMVEDAANCDGTYPEQFDDRMRELGVEVDG